MSEAFNYEAANVTVVRMDRELVRKRPGMFFGSVDGNGVLHVVSEIISNSLDQFLHGKATTVRITTDENGITVEDDGEGLPFDVPCERGMSAAERYLSDCHSTPTADDHAPHVHLNGHGLGLAVAIAACETFAVRSWRFGHLWEQHFRGGVPESRAQIVARGQGRGTTICFRPDLEVFNTTHPSPHALRKLVFEGAHLIPGVVLSLNRETFVAPKGLGDLAALHFMGTGFSRAEPQVFALNVMHDQTQIHVGLADIQDSRVETSFRSWANGSPTRWHGSHVTGLQEALNKCRFNPAVAMIHVVLHEPQFASPTRLNLANDSAHHAVAEAVAPALSRWLAEMKPRG